mmetsp:Transcript_13861/g.59336  ORF Transcript_13861/g.59336 Transcript_13861/m.59336 type:complete len:203 (+) Transcript_13861:426-1034(+)
MNATRKKAATTRPRVSHGPSSSAKTKPPRSPPTSPSSRSRRLSPTTTRTSRTSRRGSREGKRNERRRRRRRRDRREARRRRFRTRRPRVARSSPPRACATCVWNKSSRARSRGTSRLPASRLPASRARGGSEPGTHGTNGTNGATLEGNAKAKAQTRSARSLATRRKSAPKLKPPSLVCVGPRRRPSRAARVARGKEPSNRP